MQISLILLPFLFCLLTMVPAAFAQPVILDGGMTPKQFEWPFDRSAFGADKEVAFWLCVQRQGNLNRSGAFDYYFKIQVFRPDGSKVWDTVYGFDEEGYAEQKFIFPVFFYDHSPNKLSPSFGRWKIRMAVWDKNSKKDVSTREYSVTFTDGKKQQPVPAVSSTGGGSIPFPVPSFQDKQY
jgi:hypothetical protein